MTSTKLSLKSPVDVARELAKRARELRLARAWTQRTLALRAGVTLASLRRFETTSMASLDLVLKVAFALDRLEDFDSLLLPPPARSLEELEERVEVPKRQRGRI